MQIQKGGNQSMGVYKLEFTLDQVGFLNSQLPKGFILLPFTKTVKQGKGVKGKMKNNRFVDDQNSVSSSIKPVQQLSVSGNIKRQRSINVVSIQKQEQIIPKKIIVSQQMVAPELKSCWRLLQTLKRHPSSWPFLVAVDPVALQIPSYFQIIKQPMDFGTIQTNLCSGVYQTPTQFHADIGKVFMNSYRFNPVDSEYHLITKEMQQFYDKVVQNPNFPVPQKSRLTLYQSIDYSAPKRSNKRAAQTQINSKAPKKKYSQSEFLPMSVADKKTLGQNIRRLPRDALKGVWQIVSDGNIAPQQLKFDLEKLPINKVRALQRYVNSQLELNLKADIVMSKDTTQVTTRQKSEISEDAESCFVSDDDSN